MNDKTYELLNDQINKEFYSAYLYLTFADYYEERGLKGYANWYVIQAQEERDHAMLFRQYLINEGKHITAEAIAKPDKTFSSDIEPLEAALEHEKYVTSLINAIYASAYDEHDFRTMQFLDWFVKEQGEEEDNARTMIDDYKLFGSDPKGLYSLDREYLTRAYTPASLVL